MGIEAIHEAYKAIFGNEIIDGKQMVWIRKIGHEPRIYFTSRT